MKPSKTSVQGWIASAGLSPAKFTKRYVHDLSMIFNALPQRKRKIVALLSGTLIASLILLLMMRWVYTVTPLIALPDKIHLMNGAVGKRVQPPELVPLGRFASRYDNSRTRFTIAVNVRGEFLIAPENDSIWTPITTSGLEQLEMNYKFFPVPYDATTDDKLNNPKTQP